MHLGSARIAMDAVLQSHALVVAGGTNLFRYIHVENAEALWLGLLERGIHTLRFDWSKSGLRIGLPASDDELQRLDTALAEIILLA